MVLLVQASRGPGWLVMFQLAVIQDIVKVPPSSFNREQIEVLTEELDRKYSNKVVMELGLCLCVYDFLEVGEGYVYPSEGSAHHRVKVRLVVFRPFIGEVLVGKVKKNETDGVRVTMGFFDDIFIPSYLLQQPSSFDRINKCWVWTYQNEDEEARYPMEYNDQIRFRVRSIVFTESKQPAAKGVGAAAGVAARGGAGSKPGSAADVQQSQLQEPPPPAPMHIVVSTAPHTELAVGTALL